MVATIFEPKQKLKTKSIKTQIGRGQGTRHTIPGSVMVAFSGVAKADGMAFWLTWPGLACPYEIKYITLF